LRLVVVRASRIGSGSAKAATKSNPAGAGICSAATGPDAPSDPDSVAPAAETGPEPADTASSQVRSTSAVIAGSVACAAPREKYGATTWRSRACDAPS
jgi:hypothetical protein